MKKRIAFVLNTLYGGGAERIASSLSFALSPEYEVDLILDSSSAVSYPFLGKIRSLGMRHPENRGKTAYQLVALFRRIRALRRLKSSGRYAAVISFSELTSTANVLSGNSHTKTITFIQNTVSGQEIRGLRQRLFLSLLLPYLCRKADLTVACAREIEGELIDHFGLPRERSAVITNGVDAGWIRKQAGAPVSGDFLKAADGKHILVTAGRLTRQKGQWHLLKALKLLKDQKVPVHLLILGEGELRPQLEDLARRLGVADSVTMPGFVENPYAYYAAADAFVMPSLHEGFSVALLEALACGLPVVSTDHRTGAREILAPDTDYRVKVRDRAEDAACGILVPVCRGELEEEQDGFTREERILAEAIRKILTEKALAERLRTAALRRAEQLSLEEICRQWIRAIEKGREHENPCAEL